MNIQDRFPQTRDAILQCAREFFARQRPALWFWDEERPMKEYNA